MVVFEREVVMVGVTLATVVGWMGAEYPYGDPSPQQKT
jgi:hypothetical protein